MNCQRFGPFAEELAQSALWCIYNMDKLTRQRPTWVSCAGIRSGVISTSENKWHSRKRGSENPKVEAAWLCTITKL